MADGLYARSPFFKKVVERGKRVIAVLTESLPQLLPTLTFRKAM